MRTIITKFVRLCFTAALAIGLVSNLTSQVIQTIAGPSNAEMMSDSEIEITNLGFQTVMFTGDSCVFDTAFIRETYSDHFDLVVYPAPDSAEYRYRLDTAVLADIPDSLWTYGSVSDTCCFQVDMLEEQMPYAIEVRVWCPDSLDFLPWSSTIYDTTRCAVPATPTPTSSISGTKANMTYDVTTTEWEWVLQREGSPVEKHQVTDVNNITWGNLQPDALYIWKVRIRCGDGWSDYTSDQTLEVDENGICLTPEDHHYGAHNMSNDAVYLQCKMSGSQYTWAIKPHGSNTWTHKTTSSNNYQWNNLKPGTQYEYKVKVNCGDGNWSDYSKGKYFSTGEDCYVPEKHHMESKDVSYESATTYCHMKGSGYHWYIRPHHSGYGWKEDHSSHNYKKWDGLRHNTKYEYKVKVKCHDGWSDYSPTMYFTTHDKYDQHCYTPTSHHLTSKDITYNSATTHCEIKGYSYHWQLKAYGSTSWTGDHEGSYGHHGWKNLKYDTKYEYRVKVKCHSGYWTDWSAPQWFTTHKHYDECSTPKDHHLSVTNITTSSASTHCDVKGDIYHWMMKPYGSSGPWEDYTGSNAHPTWNKLKYGTKYEYKVKVQCHSGYWSGWSPTKWFTTKDHYSDYCTTPLSQHLSVTNITYNSATTHCEIKGYSYHWQVRAHGSYGAWKDYEGSNAHPVWKDLHYGTKYEYKVKVKCHSGYWTSWSPTKWFTTEEHHYDNCSTPLSSHLSANNITYNSATTHCEIKGASYHWQMRPYGSSAWTGDYQGASAHPNWKNLHYGTKYEYRVKVKCHSGYWTSWSPSKWLTTAEHHYDNCSTPQSSHLSANNITYNSATTHCEMKGASYHWQMRPYGSSAWTGDYQGTSAHPNWKNLHYGTKYEYRVKVKCHSGYWTSWSPSKWLTTAEHHYDNCTTPQSHHLSVKNISYNSASTHCGVSGADYHWYIRPYGSATWIDHYGHSNNHNWSNLKYGTKYEYKVKVKCHGGQWTGWSPVMYFTTHDHHYGNACSAPGSYDFTAIHEEYNLFRIYIYSPYKTWTSAIRVAGMDWSQHSTSANNMAWGNLLPNTEYQYRIRRECTDGSISDWSTIKSFWTGTSGRPASGEPIAIEVGAEEVFKSNVAHAGETVIYPSPASDYFTIEGNLRLGSQLMIMNLQGQTIHRHIVKNNIDNVNVQGLENGYYQVLITRADGTIESKKLIVMH